MTAHCITSRTDQIIVFKENKSVLRIANSSRDTIHCHKVDGCIINAGIRCDWMMIHDPTQQEIYVELKGEDIKHAVDQICATIDALSSRGAVRKGYIICTRSPLNSTEIQLISKKVRKSHGMVLRVRKTVHEESVERMIS